MLSACPGSPRPPWMAHSLPVVGFSERIYDLGVEALAEQERQVAELRSRGAALLAAAAVVVSLLTRSTFDGRHPDGVAEVVALAIGLLGSAGVRG